MPHTYEVIACRPRCPTVAFNKWMNPIEPPKGVCWQLGGMIHDRPVLVNYREESIHFVRNVLEVRRNVVSYVDRFFAVSASELCDIRDRSVVQRPQGVFVERFYALL